MGNVALDVRASAMKHRVIVTRKNYLPAKKWCSEHFGKKWDLLDNRTGVWRCLWSGSSDPTRFVFSFANEKDATWFALVWS